MSEARYQAILRRKEGVLVFGYPRADTGVGEVARLMIRSLHGAGIGTSCVDLHHHNPGPQTDRRLDPFVTCDLSLRVNLFSINADMMADVNATFAPPFFAERYNIARPLWELETFPDAWVADLDRIDEIWAPTEFVRRSLEIAVRDRPVLLMPMAIDPPAPAAVDRHALGIAREAFVFLFSFDPASFVSRKNPAAVIRAFAAAFPNIDPRLAVLLIKANDTRAERSPLADLDDLPLAVKVVDRPMTKAEFSGVLQLCDCYVSLHRAEGIGMAMAEAQYFGKAVIATDYGGSTDFVTPETGIPIGYRKIDLQHGDYPHWEGQSWADPDIEQAARAMRCVYENRDHARALGARAAGHIREHFGLQATGAAQRSRLKALGLVS